MRIPVTGGAGFIGANFVHWSLQPRPEVQFAWYRSHESWWRLFKDATEARCAAAAR